MGHADVWYVIIAKWLVSETKDAVCKHTMKYANKNRQSNVEATPLRANRQSNVEATPLRANRQSNVEATPLRATCWPSPELDLLGPPNSVIWLEW